MSFQMSAYPEELKKTPEKNFFVAKDASCPVIKYVVSNERIPTRDLNAIFLRIRKTSLSDLPHVRTPHALRSEQRGTVVAGGATPHGSFSSD